MTDVVLDSALVESVESVDHALLVPWLAVEGDTVLAGQVLAQARLVAQKLDRLAPRAGVVEDLRILGAQTFAPGKVLARLIPP
jgi:hypothetical protein